MNGNGLSPLCVNKSGSFRQEDDQTRRIYAGAKRSAMGVVSRMPGNYAAVVADEPGAMTTLVGTSGEWVSDIHNHERNNMSGIDKAKNKVQDAKGKVKEAAGKAGDDQSLEAKGKKDQASGNLKQAGEKVKDAFKK